MTATHHGVAPDEVNLQDVDLDDPVGLLIAARTVMDRPDALPGSAWARTTAFLARQAIETALAEYWRRTAPGTERAPFRSQFVCLRSYAGADVATEADQTWSALSDATHHHAYDLAPTAIELRRWLTTARAVVAALAAMP